ncbi:MAG TPA: hypothetical protein VMU48_13685 [Terracidiphilus sp.]|nr:hypothetical protein [Terracidiphilus sp.]
MRPSVYTFSENALASVEERVDCFGQRIESAIGHFRCFFRAGLLALDISLDEDCPHAEPAAELNVREGIAEYGAGGGSYLWKVAPCLLEHAGERFTAVALKPIVGAIVKTINVGPVRLKNSLEFGMDRFHIGGREQSEGNAALVGDHDHQHSRAIEPGNGLRHPWKHV